MTDRRVTGGANPGKHAHRPGRSLERVLVGLVLVMAAGVGFAAWRVNAGRHAAPLEATAAEAPADTAIDEADDSGVLVARGGSSGSAGTPVRDPARIAYILSSRGNGTYFGELLEARDSLNYRWPDRQTEPMRVWVQPSELDGFDTGYPQLVRDAFSTWHAAGVPIYFSFTLDSARAEILVTWIDRFDERMTGRTRWAHDRHQWIVGGSIELALHQPDGTRLDRSAVRAIALHEVGHLIGLDHTASEANVMSARVRVTELSEADRATARLVYALPPGSMRAP
ncbi:MAG TPA: matrixin family metalloprotease [Gemmatimonadaceae bacterium]|nr:matrixin family metalloprotease [Gemmatimonadaceae bacterium]